MRLRRKYEPCIQSPAPPKPDVAGWRHTLGRQRHEDPKFKAILATQRLQGTLSLNDGDNSENGGDNISHGAIQVWTARILYSRGDITQGWTMAKRQLLRIPGRNSWWWLAKNWCVSSVVSRKRRWNEKKEGRRDAPVTPQQPPRVKRNKKAEPSSGRTERRSGKPYVEAAKLALTATRSPFSNPVMVVFSSRGPL